MIKFTIRRVKFLWIIQKNPDWITILKWYSYYKEIKGVGMGKSLDNNYNLQENINFFILNSMDDWVRIIDDFGEVTFINDALKEALEKSPKLKNYLDENIDLLLSNSNSLVKSTTMIEEKLIDGKYYSIKSSPIYLGETFTGTI